MLVIGECIHVISGKVKAAIEERDGRFMQNMAARQAEAGANIIDLNIGPQRKAGTEVMSWLVNTIQEAIDLPLSLDTTNAAAIEAGLKLVKQRALINSTDATPERLSALMPLAVQYDANIIALTLAKEGLPSSADARVALASEVILPAAIEAGLPMERLFLDPLVLTVNGNQDQAQETIEAARFFKQMADPPPMTTCGLSNVSNSCPPEIRPLLNRVFLVMMHGAGIDSAIIDPLDPNMMETLRTLESGKAKDEVGTLVLALHSAYQNGERFDTSTVDKTNPDLLALAKTIDVLQNKWIYAHSYLQV